MQHFNFVNLGIGGFVFWYHEQVTFLQFLNNFNQKSRLFSYTLDSEFARQDLSPKTSFTKSFIYLSFFNNRLKLPLRFSPLFLSWFFLLKLPNFRLLFLWNASSATVNRDGGSSKNFEGATIAFWFDPDSVWPFVTLISGTATCCSEFI